MAGVSLYPLETFPVPPDELTADNLNETGQYGAIELFVERVRAILHDYAAGNITIV